MSFVESKDADRRRKSGQDVSGGGSGSAAAKGAKNAPPEDIGRALRSAYDETVNETIPPEMLDLLGKLG